MGLSRHHIVYRAGSATQTITPNDKNVIRSSVGAGLLWDSPFGPMRFDYAFALTKDKTIDPNTGTSVDREPGIPVLWRHEILGGHGGPPPRRRWHDGPAVLQLQRPLTVGEIAALTGATPAAGASLDRRIGGIAALDQAGPGDLAFMDNPRYAAQLPRTRAGVCLIGRRFVARGACERRRAGRPRALSRVRAGRLPAVPGRAAPVLVVRACGRGAGRLRASDGPAGTAYGRSRRRRSVRAPRSAPARSSAPAP